MYEQARALDVPQELRAKPCAFVRAFDQSRYVCDHEALVVWGPSNHNDAQVGLESSERIVRDFGTSGGDARNQSRFSNIGITYESNIGEQLEFESEGALFAGAAILVLTRRL